MTNPTRRELLDILAGSVALTAWATRALAVMPEEAAPAPALPAPAFNHGSVSLTAHDIGVQPGAAYVDVPVSLSAPAAQTMTAKFLTQNDTAKEGQQFARAEGHLTFHPGERAKVVRVPLKGSLTTAQRFKLVVGWPQNNPAMKIAKGTATISGDPSVVAPVLDFTAYPLPARPSLPVVFEDRFGSFEATDSGLGAGGKPCWRSRPIHGRTQPGNKELGYYADPTINPGTTPFLKDARGRLVLQAEHIPAGVRNAAGAVQKHEWNTAEVYDYTASMITSDRLFPVRRGDYMEARLTMPRVRGSWPAFWLAPNDGSWPSVELDVFEGFFRDDSGALERVGTTVHWRDGGGNHAMFGTMNGHTRIDLAQPHTWGVHWGDQLVTFYVDDVAFFAVPNVFPDKDCHMMLNIGVGGSTIGAPASPGAGFPVQMPVEFVRVLRG